MQVLQHSELAVGEFPSVFDQELASFVLSAPFHEMDYVQSCLGSAAMMRLLRGLPEMVTESASTQSHEHPLETHPGSVHIQVRVERP